MVDHSTQEHNTDYLVETHRQAITLAHQVYQSDSRHQHLVWATRYSLWCPACPTHPGVRREYCQLTLLPLHSHQMFSSHHGKGTWGALWGQPWRSAVCASSVNMEWSNKKWGLRTVPLFALNSSRTAKKWSTIKGWCWLLQEQLLHCTTGHTPLREQQVLYTFRDIDTYTGCLYYVFCCTLYYTAYITLQSYRSLTDWLIN